MKTKLNKRKPSEKDSKSAGLKERKLTCLGHLVVVTAPPGGWKGKAPIMVSHTFDSIQSAGPYAKYAGAILDWFNDRMQILIYDSKDNEPAVTVRFTKNGQVAEVAIRTDLHTIVMSEKHASNWLYERDK